MENKKEKKERFFGRRSFMKLAGLSAFGLSMGFPLRARWAMAEESPPGGIQGHWWRKNEDGYAYFVQDNLRTDWLDQGYLLAKLDHKWMVFKTAEFEEEFHTWWLEEKLSYYDKLERSIAGEDVEIPNGGHHHPMLGTYGNKYRNRGDSYFHLNVTPKGYTLLPKAEYIRQIIEEVDEIYNTSTNLPADIFNYRKEKYQNEDLWDKNKFATLEVYTGHPIDDDDPMKLSFKETHTFQNVMVNPMTTVTYMSVYNTQGGQSYFYGEEGQTPTFEFRGFCWMISPYNPKLTQYETDVSDYLNQAFSKYHGLRDDFIANIFVICEEFNNSPTDSDLYGLGKRVVPEFTYGDALKAKLKSFFGKKGIFSKGIQYF
jgi:hypothetical protein